MEVKQGVHVFMNQLVNLTEFLAKVAVLRPGEFELPHLIQQSLDPDWWNGRPYTSYFRLLIQLDALPTRVFLTGDKERVFTMLQTIMGRPETPNKILALAAALKYIPLDDEWICAFGFLNAERALVKILSVSGSPRVMINRFAPRGVITNQKMITQLVDLKSVDLIPSGWTAQRSTMTTADFTKLVRAIPQHMLLHSHNEIVAWVNFQGETLDTGYVSELCGSDICGGYAAIGIPPDIQAAASAGAAAISAVVITSRDQGRTVATKVVACELVDTMEGE